MNGTATEGREATEFQDTPGDWARRWAIEFDVAKKTLKDWKADAQEAVNRFIDKREKQDDRRSTRVNLYTSSTQTQRAMLFGSVPKVAVTRRFADAADDVARVAGEMEERILNEDIQDEADSYVEAMGLALDDRQQAGFGLARWHYVVEEEETETQEAILDSEGAELAPAVPSAMRKTYECVEAEHVQWSDVLWNKARMWREVRWLAFRAEMTREALVKRFGGDVGNKVPLNSNQPNTGDRAEVKRDEPWGRAEVWEIWDKESKRVFWFCEGYPEVLDSKPDPLGLKNFFPCARPMVANVTTSSFVPLPEFQVAKDLYVEVDNISTRITLLEEAIRVAGVYDKSAGGLSQLLNSKAQNVLIPIDNWPLFRGEKGGIQGTMDFVPLEQVVAALSALRDYRRELMDLIFQVTGMSDIMRGQANTPDVTATEQTLKAKFGSVRMQALQNEFARFCSDMQRIKAEIMAKHFDAQTFIQRSNVLMTPDAPYAQAAAELLKSEDAVYRIEVNPETLSLTDFAQKKADRLEILAAIAQVLQSAAPLVQQMPGAMTTVLRTLQWAVSGLRGSSEFEGILDEAIKETEQAQKQAAMQPPQQAPNPMSDPKVVAQQMKGQQDLEKIQAQMQADITTEQAKVQGDANREQAQAYWNTREAAAKEQITAAGRALTPRPPPTVGGL